MLRRQFLWGLSIGVSVFAIAGAFWFGLGITSVLTPSTSWRVWAVAKGIQAGTLLGLLWASARLRRRSGFRASDFRNGDERERAEARHTRARFAWIGLAQAVLIGVVVWWCVRVNAVDRVWPGIGLVVSLHFLPLARLFHVRAYYATAAAGAIASLAALAAAMTSQVLSWYCAAMTGVMWLTALYLVLAAERIAARGVNRPPGE
jgi:hypothetical protein